MEPIATYKTHSKHVQENKAFVATNYTAVLHMRGVICGVCVSVCVLERSGLFVCLLYVCTQTVDDVFCALLGSLPQ